MTAHPAAVLAALIDEEFREVQSFAALLRQEQELLVKTDAADALLPLVDRKTQSTARLKALADRREQCLRAAGLPAGRAGMEAWQAAAPAAACKRWQELLATAAEVRALNETNGRLIGIHWKHNQAALTALMSAADRAMTYGPDGQQRGGGGGRSFGSA